MSETTESAVFSHNNLIIIRYTSLIIFLLPPCFGKNSPTFLFSFPARHRPSHHTKPLQDGPAFGDGFQRPTDEPATAEEALLQPGAHRRRAGAVGRKPPQQIQRYLGAKAAKMLRLWISLTLKQCKDNKNNWIQSIGWRLNDNWDQYEIP